MHIIEGQNLTHLSEKEERLHQARMEARRVLCQLLNLNLRLDTPVQEEDLVARDTPGDLKQPEIYVFYFQHTRKDIAFIIGFREVNGEPDMHQRVNLKDPNPGSYEVAAVQPILSRMPEALEKPKKNRSHLRLVKS